MHNLVVMEKTYTLDTIYDALNLFLQNYPIIEILDIYGPEELAICFKGFISETYYPGMKTYTVEFWRKKEPNRDYSSMLSGVTDTHYLVHTCKISDRELERIKNNSNLKENHYSNGDVYYEIFDDEDLWHSIEGI